MTWKDHLLLKNLHIWYALYTEAYQNYDYMKQKSCQKENLNVAKDCT